MRFTLYEKGAPEKGSLVFLGEVEGAHEHGFPILQDGISGWYGTPAIRENTQEIISRDGGRAPINKTQASRIVTIEFALITNSSVELAEQIDDIYQYIGKDLELMVEDEFGRRFSECYIADDPGITPYHTEHHALGALVLCCPDPRKYGESVTYWYSEQQFIANGGNVCTCPVIEVESASQESIKSVQITAGGDSVTWTGEASSVKIDCKSMTCSNGRFTKPGLVTIKPEGEDLTIHTNTNVRGTIYITPAWR